MAAFALSKLKMSGRLVVEPFAPKDIFDAAFIGDMQAVRAFADVEGWDKDAQEHITGRTALHKCCQGSQGRVLTFLLEHHCSTTMTDSHGMNAIHIAERYGYKVSVRRKLSLHRSLFFSLSLPPPPRVCTATPPRSPLSLTHTRARARSLPALGSLRYIPRLPQGAPGARRSARGGAGGGTRGRLGTRRGGAVASALLKYLEVVQIGRWYFTV